MLEGGLLWFREPRRTRVWIASKPTSGISMLGSGASRSHFRESRSAACHRVGEAADRQKSIILSEALRLGVDDMTGTPLEPMSTPRVFTRRSIGIGVASGVLVAGALGQFDGAARGLAVLNGLAAGAVALAGSICMRDGRFAFLLEKEYQRRLGVGMLACMAATMVAPMVSVEHAIGRGLLDRGDERALSLLFGCTAFAAYFLRGIMVRLAHLDGDAATAGPRLDHVPPSPGELGPMTPLRVFTARSTGIGIATGVLVAIALGQLLDAARGLAILNGLAAGALAQALSIGDLRGGWWFDTTGNRRRPGVRALAYAVMMAPTLFVHRYIELAPADEVAVSVLFLLIGFASCILGGMMATLAYLDRDAVAADLRLHRVTPPPGERRGS
jgi:type IV secretory pathway TrbD component